MSAGETEKHQAQRHLDDADLESGNGQGALLGRQMSVQLTAEQFERLYLQPGGVGGKGDLSKRLGNPTALGLFGFLLCLTPVSGFLMGWGGTSLAANTVMAPVFVFMGGVCMVISGIFELIIGNTFPATVFISFSAFWFVFGLLFLPTQGISAAYESAADINYNHGLAIYLAWWGLVVLIYLVAALRTNVVFVILFTVLDITFWLLVTIFYYIGAETHATQIPSLMKAAGAFAFLTSACGWYLFAVLIFGSTGVPFALPVGDLSGFMSGKKKNV